MTIMILLLCLYSAASADIFWGSGSPGWGVASPALFKFDTGTGTVQTTYTYSTWSWIMDVEYAPGNVLYAVHNTTANSYSFSLAKINAATGVVISDTPLDNLTTVDSSMFNALEYQNGKLYGVENWSSKRGYTYEITLDGSDDPVSAALGAYVGAAPDGALAYKDGVYYASDWKTDSSSRIMTSANIMTTNFSESGSTSPVGLIAGWDFETDGDMLGVSWYYDFNVYQINLTTGAATALYNLKSQLPSNLTMYSGLTDVPEPATMALLSLGGLALLRKKHHV